MKRKLVAMLLAAAMVCGLSACGGGGESSDSSSGKTSTGDESSSESGTAPENTDSGETKKVVMSFMFYTGAPSGAAEIQEAVNAIMREKSNVEIEFLISDASSFKQNTTLALSGGEQIDILWCNGTIGYTNQVQQGYLLDMEENDLLRTFGQGILENVDKTYIDACRISGVLYGLPNNRDMAQGRGCTVIVDEYLESIGYEWPDTDDEIIKISMEELNEMYVKLHEQYPDKEVYRPVVGSMLQFSNVDAIGGNVFGVLLDYGTKAEVQNLFTSDYYNEYCKKVYDYNQKGYVSQDAVTDTTSITELVSSGKLISYTTGGKPGIKVQETGLCRMPVTVFQTMDDYISANSVSSMPWVIPVNTGDAEAAMKALNLMYADAEVANLLSWGIEGTHYQKQDDGLITFADGVDASTSSFYHSQQWMLPNQFITNVWSGNAPDLWNKIETFNNEAQKSVALGFNFDTSAVQTEMTALQNVYDEYQKSIEFGMVDPDTAIEEMNGKMLSAGLEAVMKEKQAQLDTFMQTK